MVLITINPKKGGFISIDYDHTAFINRTNDFLNDMYDAYMDKTVVVNVEWTAELAFNKIAEEYGVREGGDDKLTGDILSVGYDYTTRIMTIKRVEVQTVQL